MKMRRKIPAAARRTATGMTIRTLVLPGESSPVPFYFLPSAMICLASMIAARLVAMFSFSAISITSLTAS